MHTYSEYNGSGLKLFNLFLGWFSLCTYIITWLIHTGVNTIIWIQILVGKIWFYLFNKEKTCTSSCRLHSHEKLPGSNVYNNRGNKYRGVIYKCTRGFRLGKV